ncbi:MAG: diaminopimelate decarboxylase, partial [Thermotoga sp.]
MDFHTIAIKYGTPVYIYDGNTILKNCRTVLETFDDLDLIPTFALKANSNPNIVRLINSTGFGADVVSKGELLASLKAGVPPFKIVWNGTGKKISDMEYFLSVGVGFINVDSFEEMDRWLEMMKCEKKSTVKFLVRVNPNVDAHTHPHISTGLKENKFGIDISEFDRFMSKFGGYISGIHVHIGSQITEVEPFVETYEQIISLLMKYDLEYFNLGGGWGIDYGDGKHLNLDEYKERVIPILKEFS